MKTLALVLLVLSVAEPLAAQSVEKQLVAARDTVWRAYFHNDTALLRRYIPPAAATAEGSKEMRWNTRSDIMDGARGFANSKARLIDVKFSDSQFSIAGHSALLRSNYAVIVESGGRRDTTRGRATELFVRQGSTWVNPYWQLEQGAVGAAREIPLPDTLGANFAIGDTAKMAGNYRTFDPKRRVWQMIGSSSDGGEIQPGLTWSDGRSRYAIQRNHGVLSRIRYVSIEADSFLWRSDVSTDGGKTWLLDAGTMEARRIAK